MLESAQAKIVAGFAALSLLVSLIVLIRVSTQTSGQLKKVWLTFALFMFVISILLLALTVYDVNCTIIGGCSVWGWIKTVLICIGLFLGIAANLIGLVVGSTVTTAHEEEEDKKKKKEAFRAKY